MSLKRFQLNYHVLTGFLIVALPVLALGVILVLGSGQARLRDSYGRQLAEVAERTAAAVDSYVFRRIVDVSILARVPDLPRLAAAENQRPLDTAAVQVLDRQWKSEPVLPAGLATAIMLNPAAQFFNGIVEHDPVYREIMLTDRFGRLIGASNRTSDYYQADEAWWREVVGDGVHGRVSVSDVLWDDSAKAYALDIAVPVNDSSTGTLVGVLKTSADVREMLAAVAGVQLGATGHAVLVREDGSIVFGRMPVTPGARFFAADLLRERLQGARKAGPAFATYFSARDADGQQQVVGVASTQLGRSYPTMAWLVAVYQSDHELFAPIQNQFWHLLLVLAMTAVAVLGFALWFSIRLTAPPIDVAIGMDRPAPVPTKAT